MATTTVARASKAPTVSRAIARRSSRSRPRVARVGARATTTTRETRARTRRPTTTTTRAATTTATATATRRTTRGTTTTTRATREENALATAIGATAATLARTRARTGRALTLALVAGAWAQSVNLGGTFALALFRAHEVPIVAAAFALGVAAWKFACAQYARTCVLRREGEKEGEARSDRRGVLAAVNSMGWSVRAAHGELKDARGVLASLCVLDLRRLASVAWNSLITVPIPYLGLIKLLDFAVAGPVLVNEGKTPREAMARSRELMYGYRVLLMKTTFLCSTVCAALVCGTVGAFVACVPSLPNLMLGAEATTVGEAAAGFINGAAFDRVWVLGTPLERAATFALLVCGLVLSFLFTLGFRELLSLFYEETTTRYSPPPPLDASAIDATNKPSLWRRAQFWRKE